MFQNRNPLPQRDFFPPRETNWHPAEIKGPFLDVAQEGGFTASPLHPRALTIEAALRDCVRLPVKEFALVVVLENGEEKTYTSQSLTPYQPNIFTDNFRHDFWRNVRRAASATEGWYPNSAYNQGAKYNKFEPNNQRKHSSSGDSLSGRSCHYYQRQSTTEEYDEEDSGNGKRKRACGAVYSGPYSNDDTPIPVSVQKAQELTIGDEAEVEKFYFVRFTDMQQSSCKIMGKAFVKLVEPKKQTHYPYTKGDAEAPSWWPKTAGDNYIRHREPDHLLKPERIRLLVHILRMMPPHKQHPTVQKLGLNVRKLEEATMEAMSTWFNDADHPENVAKKPFLKEIFKVAKNEERYKNGEIDADTRNLVMYGNRRGIDVSDDEVEEDVKDEVEENDSAQVASNMQTLESLVNQPIMQNQQLQQPQETDTTTIFPRTRPLPVRYHTTQPQIEEHASYSDLSYLACGVGVGFQTHTPNPQYPSRRSSRSPGYESTQQSMYGWQNDSMVSYGAMSSNYYVTSSQSSITPQGRPYRLPPPPTQQPMLPPPPPMVQRYFDGMPNGRQYDSGPVLGNQLRTSSLGHPHQLPHRFQEYLHENDGYGHNNVELKDDQHIYSR